MHNRLVEGALRVRKWTHYQEALQRERGETVSTEPTGTARRVVESEADRIVEYLLFAGEIPLRDGVQGNAAFQTAFRRNRKADSRGRSLKDLDLRTRLFAHRCSYMIYSPAFNSLPAVLSARVYRRLHEVLTAPQAPKPFGHLGAEERQAIREILVATKPDLASAWSTPR